MAPPSVRSVDVINSSAKNPVAIATRNAANISDLISTVPQTWRSACADHLNKVYRIAQKLCNVQNTIAGYERHVAAGSQPASIKNAIRDPRVQYSKEYLGTEQGSLVSANLEAHLKEVRTGLLKFALSQKKEEMKALQNEVTWDQVRWRKLILGTAHRTAETVGLTVEGDAAKEPPPTWTEGTPSSLKEDCMAMWNYGSTYHYRAIAIARSLADRSLMEKAKTLSLKGDTDQEMKDINTEAPMRDVVKEELQQQIKLLKLDLVKTLGQSKKSGPQKNGKKGRPNNPSGVKKGRPPKKSGPKRKTGR